jgi:hypothetical protein
MFAFMVFMFSPNANPRTCVTFRNMFSFFTVRRSYPPPTPNLKGRPLSAVRDCLFNIFVAALHIWRPCSISGPEWTPCHGE